MQVEEFIKIMNSATHGYCLDNMFLTKNPEFAFLRNALLEAGFIFDFYHNEPLNSEISVEDVEEIARKYRTTTFSEGNKWVVCAPGLRNMKTKEWVVLPRIQKI